MMTGSGKTSPYDSASGGWIVSRVISSMTVSDQKHSDMVLTAKHAP